MRSYQSENSGPHIGDRMQKQEQLFLALQEANELTLAWPITTAPSMCQEPIKIFQTDGELSEMLMEKELRALKLTEREEPKKLGFLWVYYIAIEILSRE